MSAEAAAARTGDRRAPGLPYAPGLDGLRAIAVVAVIAYHARPGWLPGGFLGVDVFFVLSGYLITSLLLAERRATGTVRLGRFWARRARRLLPAAFTVIAVCVVVTVVLAPGRVPAVRTDALASLLYVNNWHQILADHSYFASFGPASPLLHLWSLSVEEQFYLVWPLVLIAVLRTGGRGRVSALVLMGIAATTVAMALLYHTGADPSRVYYGTDTRAGPLLVGVLLALALERRRVPSPVVEAAGVIGLTVLAVVLLRVHDYDPSLYRGGLLLVAVAVAGIVAACAQGSTRVGQALGIAPLRWAGRRSYGLYLWHWPAIVLLGANGWAIALAVVLAVSSFRLIEEPFRRGDAQRTIMAWMDRRAPRQRLAVVLVGVVVIASVVGLAASAHGPSGGAPPLLASASAAARAPVSSAVPAASATSGHTSSTPSRMPSASKEPGVLAVGASVMLGATTALEQRLGPGTRVDAMVGRQVGAVLDRLDSYRKAGRLPDRVVVQMGENGPVFGADVLRLKRILKGVPDIVLVNVRVPRSWESEVNDILAETARAWGPAKLADWYAASSRPGLLYDGAHPDPAGQRAYAGVVAHALG